MRNLSNVLQQDILNLLPRNATPMERLKAIIDGSFVPRHFSGANRKAWIQFMMESQTDQEIRHLMRVTGARFVSNIRYAVRGLVPAPEIIDVADGIAAMIDVFFSQIAADYNEKEFENARHICWHVCLLAHTNRDLKIRVGASRTCARKRRTDVKVKFPWTCRKLSLKSVRPRYNQTQPGPKAIAAV